MSAKITKRRVLEIGLILLLLTMIMISGVTISRGYEETPPVDSNLCGGSAYPAYPAYPGYPEPSSDCEQFLPLIIDVIGYPVR